MKVICTNIGPEEFGGQIEWQGSAANFTTEVDYVIKTAFDADGNRLDREEAGHIFVYELDDQDRRDLAYKHITKYYPEWKQLNIIRSGSSEELTSMSSFIDACREWSNSDSNDPFEITEIQP